MDEMEKNELEKNEELEPKEAVETKEEPTQDEASVTDAPAAEEAVETAEEPVTAEASVEETAEEPEIEETEELKQEEAKQEEQPAEAPAAQKAEKGGVLGIVIGLIALIAIVAYAWMNPMGKAVDTGILYTKDDNLYYYDLKNEPYQVQEGLSNGGTYHYFYTAWGASVTEDGSYLYFSDDVDENGAFVLYRRDAKNADAKAAQIDTDVYDYMASKDGKVVAYLKKSGETYALCVYDGKQVQTVKTGINLENDVYALSGDGKYLAFTDTTGLLNAVAVGKNMEDNILPLTDSAETYALAEESGILYYVAAGKDGYNIFSYDFKGEPKTAVENVSSMEMMPNGRDVLYCKKSEEKVLYKDIIVDDMAEQDAKLKKGDEGYEQKVQRDEIRKAMKNGEGFEPLLQKIRGNVRRYPDGWGEAAPLTGLLYCADCGGKMYVHRTNNGKRISQYTCSQYTKVPCGTLCKTQHRINEDVVLSLVSEMLKAIAEYAKHDRAEFVRVVQEAQSSQQTAEVRKQRTRLATAKQRVSELEVLLCKIYEDNILGKLSDSRYATLDAQYEKEQSELTAEISVLEKAVKSYEKHEKDADRFIALIDKYENFDKLTIAMLNEFIEKILVHERDRKGSIQTTQEVEIYFNFVGRFVPPAFGEVELTPEELEEIRKREERKDRLHQNYLKRKASGAQKRYEDKIKERKKAEIEAKKAAIRAEDIAKGVFVPVSSLPQREPMKGVQSA